jgi:hypothetical protein
MTTPTISSNDGDTEQAPTSHLPQQCAKPLAVFSGAHLLMFLQPLDQVRLRIAHNNGQVPPGQHEDVVPRVPTSNCGSMGKAVGLAHIIQGLQLAGFNGYQI